MSDLVETDLHAKTFMETHLTEYGLTEDQARAAINIAIVAKKNGYAEGVQAALMEIDKLAMPPLGHSCPDCNAPGDLYCLSTAIERFRGLDAYAADREVIDSLLAKAKARNGA